MRKKDAVVLPLLFLPGTFIVLAAAVVLSPALRNALLEGVRNHRVFTSVSIRFAGFKQLKCLSRFFPNL